MTWTSPGGTTPDGFIHNTGTMPLTTHSVGNLVIVIATCHSTTFSPTGFTSTTPNVTGWTQVVPTQSFVNANISQAPDQWQGSVWFGTVSAVSTDSNLTPTFTGALPAFVNYIAQEFNSSTGSWSLNSFAVLNNASGTNTWPSLTPAGNNELYLGFAWNFGSSVAGSTSGYSYNANADTASNGMAYNLSCAGGVATAPTFGDSTETYGIMILVSGLPSSSSASGSSNANFPPSFYAKSHHAQGMRRRWKPRQPAIAPQGNPKIATLIDNFATNDLAALWGQTIGTVTWSLGQVAVKSDTSYDSALATNGPYDLTSSAIYIRIAPYVATSSDIQFLLFQGQLATSNNNMLMGFGGPSNLHIFKTIAGAQTNIFSTTYNAGTMAWWRIRESGGTVFFDTAPDGSTWTNQFSTVDSTFSFPLTAVGVSLLGGDAGSDPAGTTFLYRVNTNTGAQFSSTIGATVVNFPGTLTREAFRIMTATAAVTGSISRKISRALTATLVTLGIVTRNIGRTVTATVVAFASIVATYIPGHVEHFLTVGATLVTTVSTQRMIGRILAAVSAVTGSLARSISRPLNAVIVFTSAVTRSVSRSVSATIVVTASLVRSIMRSIVAVVVLTASTVIQKFKQLTLSAVVVVTSSTARQVGRPLTAVVVTTASITRFLSRALNAVVVSVSTLSAARMKFLTLIATVVVNLTLTRTVGKPITSIVVLSTSVFRSINRLVTPVISVVVTVSRALTRTLTAIVVLTAATVISKFKIIILTATTVITAVTTRSVGKVIFGVVSITGSTARACTRNIFAGIAVTGSLTRSIGRGITTVVTLTVSVAFLKFKQVILTATVVTVAVTSRFLNFHVSAVLSVTGSTFRRCGRAIASSLAITGSLTRNVLKNLTSTVVLTGSIAFLKVKNVFLTCTVAITGTTSRKILPIISAVATIAVSTTRGISRSIQGTFAVAGQTVRQMGRGCAAGMVATSQVARQIGRNLNVPVSVTLVITRFTGYIVATGISVLSAVNRNVRKSFTATLVISSAVITGGAKYFVTLVVPLVVTTSVSYGRYFFKTLIAGITLGSSVATQVFRLSADIVFRKGTMAFQWIVGSVSGRWKT